MTVIVGVLVVVGIVVVILVHGVVILTLVIGVMVRRSVVFLRFVDGLGVSVVKILAPATVASLVVAVGVLLSGVTVLRGLVVLSSSVDALVVGVVTVLVCIDAVFVMFGFVASLSVVNGQALNFVIVVLVVMGV